MKLILERSREYYKRNKKEYQKIYKEQAKNYRLRKENDSYIVETLDYKVWNERFRSDSKDKAVERMCMVIELVIFPDARKL
jgi:hypothetical protein